MTEHYYRLRDYALNHAECKPSCTSSTEVSRYGATVTVVSRELAPADQQTVRKALSLLEASYVKPARHLLPAMPSATGWPAARVTGAGRVYRALSR